MKPVVSSIVALAIAIAPAYAMAAEKHGKPVAAKVVKHKKTSKAEKADKIEKSDKDKSDAVVTVRHGKKDKPEIHRASARHVDGGHKGEPKVDHGVTVIPASMMTKPKKQAEPPKLPSPNAKPGKNAAEKGARKATSKKHDDDEQSARDEDFAELVARIRGNQGTRSEAKDPSKAKHVENAKCWKDPVEVIRGAEIEKLTLMKCDGSIAPLAVEQLSILLRPGSAARPIVPLEELAKKKGPEIAKGIRRVDARLVERLQAIVDHFGEARKGAGPMKLDIVSGYRPTSPGSMHSSGRAIDFRIEGVDNEKVVAFCKTLEDTGCGFYPNSSFVHVDVREAGAGHVTWIDASGPGETPRYVSAWPPPHGKSARGETKIGEPGDADESDDHKGIDRASMKTLDREAAPEPVDEHPSSLPDLPKGG
jgi:hypothetical protein